jgi:hypothetical protein
MAEVVNQDAGEPHLLQQRLERARQLGKKFGCEPGIKSAKIPVTPEK